MSGSGVSWGKLTGGTWRTELPGCELVASGTTLTETDGEFVWCEERVYRGGTVWVFVSLERGEDGERSRVVVGPTPEGLAEAVRESLGLTPGRVEVLGRAEIEVGLEPGEEEMD